VIVDDEIRAVAVTATPPSALANGLLLAVRVGVAPHEQVVSRADEWLVERRGWSRHDISDVRGAAADLKKRLAQARMRKGVTALRNELVSRDIGVGYANVLVNHPLEQHYIAPQRRVAFEVLAHAIGAPHLVAEFDRLAAVRTAHQQAGEQIRRELVQRLGDQRWIGIVDEYGWLALAIGDLGTLLLTVISAIIDEPAIVQRTSLGTPIDEFGRRVLILPTTEELL
jgi:hypothetical protein